ncbi:hypothetical protein O3G_MSEX009409 [Manduca sexta]|uniref:C2H2-type domain-containing protein n=1 Tax=Manduca sexta TaxID=7130 RepID=A0A921ZFC8_MANSE|nr:hypothetical protein O3G_MSEX009409 [Manduca sexta]
MINKNDVIRNFQWRRPPAPRAFYGSNNDFRPRPAQMLQNANLEHWCETCDRGFPTENLLIEHKSQHQKCNIDGCQFVAHPKVITKHIQMQHSSGLFKKISNLNNPEEIKKWREERKRNFPTRSNIEKKAAELKEKIDRGEKMGLKHTQRPRDAKQGNKRKLVPGFKHHNDRKDFKKKKICNANNEDEVKNKPTNKKNADKYLPPVEERRIPQFGGIQGLITGTEDKDDAEETDSNLIIEDDDNERFINNSKEIANSNEPVLCGALVSLMCQYGSSDEEDNNTVDTQAPTTLKDTNIIKNKSDSKSQSKENKENFEVHKLSSDHSSTLHDDNDSGPEEVKVEKSIEVEGDEASSKEITKQMKKRHLDKKEIKHVINSRRQKSKLPSTLLQKLLFKEIQYERNMVLQCIRYIVKNDFFDK